MTDSIYSRPGVVEAIDVHGRPFGVPLPNVEPGQIVTDDEAEQEWQRHVDAVPMREPDDVPVDRDLQRVIAWSLIGFWGVLLWWVLS